MHEKPSVYSLVPSRVRANSANLLVQAQLGTGLDPVLVKLFCFFPGLGGLPLPTTPKPPAQKEHAQQKNVQDLAILARKGPCKNLAPARSCNFLFAGRVGQLLKIRNK